MNVNKLEPDFSTAVMTLSGIGWTRPRIAKAFSAGQSRRKRATIYRCVSLTSLALLFAASALAADKKISELTSGSPLQATDMIPIARGTANFRLAGSDFTPKEVDCSDFLGFGTPPCSVPPSISYARTVSFTEWTSQYTEPFQATLLNANTRGAGLSYGIVGAGFTHIRATAPLGAAQYSDLYGGSILAEEAGSGTTTTGESWVYGLDVRAKATTATIHTNLIGLLGSADSTTASQSIGEMNGVVGSAYPMNTTATISSHAAGVHARGPASKTRVGTDINKIYKFYTSHYGRNYFGQPDDAGLYAAEVVGDKGLLAGGANGQFQLSDVGSRPTCDAAHRGSFWYEAGGVGVADTVEVCRKDASNNYAWVSVI